MRKLHWIIDGPLLALTVLTLFVLTGLLVLLSGRDEVMAVIEGRETTKREG